MEKEESYFIKTVILLAKIQNLAKDDFFAEKLYQKICNFSLTFFGLVTEKGRGNIVQYNIQKEKYFAGINALLDVLKEFKYFNFVAETPLLLEAERNLLVLKLEILKNSGKKEFMIGNHEEPPQPIKQTISAENMEIAGFEPKENYKLQMNLSKKKILDFIKSFPNTRAKDIIYEFNTLSNRTVKRNLTDLLKAGLLRKRIDNRATYYYVSESLPR